MQFLKGDSFTLNNEKVEILDQLGKGGQGVVYKVRYMGGEYALKMYIEEPSSDFKYNLKNNIKKGTPSESFLWPKESVEFDDGSFGYLMDLRPSEYETFTSYLNHGEFKDQETLIKWCIELCSAFKKLHENGFSYQDLNCGGFFIQRDTGKLLICDNDNVTADKKNLGILGMPKYMAPEVGRGDILPDTHSDRFSLAIILFQALCKGFPFDGERLKKYDIMDETAEYELYSKDPLFVYHKTDKSNRPIRGYHAAVLMRWPVIPVYIKEAFHRTFVDGIKDRENERTTELEWVKLLSKYRDELITCPKCGRQYIAGFSEKKPTTECPVCSAKVKKTLILRIGRHTITLDLGKKLFMTHVDKYSSEYNKVVGKVVANKNNPSLWGIKLGLENDIEVKDSVGKVKIIAKDGVIPLIADLKIKFSDTVIGEIKEK